jgi:hypothetical protein
VASEGKRTCLTMCEYNAYILTDERKRKDNAYILRETRFEKNTKNKPPTSALLRSRNQNAPLG